MGHAKPSGTRWERGIYGHYPIFEGWKRYEIANHLGNVLAVITDRKRGNAVSGTAIQWFEVDVVSAQQYYPFGMLMPGNASAALRRQYTLNSYDYRYGFNGKEGDDEIKGDDNQQDYGMRIYDPRVARFLSVDPIAKEYPWYTPYQFAGNMPIWAVDLDGLEPSRANGYKTTDEGLKVLDGSAREQGPLVERREIKQSVQKSRVRVETIDVPYREKVEQAMRDNAVNAAKFFIADPQALRNGDRLEWASILLGPFGKESSILIKEAKALRYGDNLVEIGGQVAKHSDEAKRVGHLTPWVQMTKAEAKAFQHSYSRHASELGLPNWSQTKAAELQGVFNNAVSYIRNAGSNGFFRSQEFVNGVKTTVNKTEPLINGQKFYDYETLEGKFVSAGKIQ